MCVCVYVVPADWWMESWGRGTPKKEEQRRREGSAILIMRTCDSILLLSRPRCAGGRERASAKMISVKDRGAAEGKGREVKGSDIRKRKRMKRGAAQGRREAKLAVTDVALPLRLSTSYPSAVPESLRDTHAHTSHTLSFLRAVQLGTEQRSFVVLPSPASPARHTHAHMRRALQSAPRR